jgi:hypothetical protein
MLTLVGNLDDDLLFGGVFAAFVGRQGSCASPRDGCAPPPQRLARVFVPKTGHLFFAINENDESCLV